MNFICLGVIGVCLSFLIAFKISVLVIVKRNPPRFSGNKNNLSPCQSIPDISCPRSVINPFSSINFIFTSCPSTRSKINRMINKKRIMNYRMYRIIFLGTQKKIFHHYAHLSRMVLWHNNQQAESQI